MHKRGLSTVGCGLPSRPHRTPELWPHHPARARIQGCLSTQRLFWGHLPRQPGGSSTFLAPVRTLAGGREEPAKQPGAEVEERQDGQAPGEARGDAARGAVANLGLWLLLGSPGALFLLLSACSELMPL